MHRATGGRQVRGAGPLALAALLLIGALQQACSDNTGPVGPTFPAKVVGDAIGGPAGTINIQASVSPGIVDRGRRASVTIMLTSAGGAPLQGRQVVVSSTGGRFDQSSGTTDGDGIFRTTIYVPCEVADGPYAITVVVEGKSAVLEGAFSAATSLSNDPCAGVIPAPAPGGGGTTPTLPTVSITSSGTATEGVLPSSATFTVTRTGSTGAGLSVVLVASGSATFGLDYGLVGGSIVGTTVTIPAGSASVTFTLNPVDDALVEPDDPSGPTGPVPAAEVAILTISPASTYTVGAPTAAQVEIVDND
jgi:hypothetical protein